MRQLKHHEAKLLKKVDFLRWKQEDSLRELQVMRRYHIQDREDYKRYNRIVGMVTKTVSILKTLDARDAGRIEMTDRLLDKCARAPARPARPACRCLLALPAPAAACPRLQSRPSGRRQALLVALLRRRRASLFSPPPLPTPTEPT